MTLSCDVWATHPATFAGVGVSAEELRGTTCSTIWPTRCNTHRIASRRHDGAKPSCHNHKDARYCPEHRCAARREAEICSIHIRQRTFPVADFDASKDNFERQVRDIRSAALPSQLYKAVLEALGKLSKERGDRKAIIILGDGVSDDTSHEHDQVVSAAKDAHVMIHALGFTSDLSGYPILKI